MDEQEAYIKEYNDFINKYEISQVSAEEVGLLICRLANYFAQKNAEAARCNKLSTSKSKEIINMLDEATGKPITIGKAELLIDATEESIAYEEAKRNIQNIEQMINALKSLQKGVLNEFGYAGA